MNEFDVGDRVVCNAPGSWVHGKAGVVLAVNVTSSDGITGYQLRIDGSDGYTVVPWNQLAAELDPRETASRQAADLVEQAANLVREAAIKLSGTGWGGHLGDTASDLFVIARGVRDFDPTSD